MSVVQIEIPEALLEQARKIAELSHVRLDEVVSDALKDRVSVEERLAYVRTRAERGSSVDIKAILSKSPDVDPEQSDRIE